MIRNHVKLTLLGQSATGKTSIATRLVNNKFSETYENTIGASFMMLKINNLMYDIWDTAGQERYLSLVQLYYRNTDIFLLIFDVKNLLTLERLIYYIEKMLQNVSSIYKILIIGNKIDLIDEKEISEIDKIVKSKMSILDTIKDKVEFLYVAAKTGKNFNNMINIISQFGEQLKNDKNNILDNNIDKNKDNINLQIETNSTSNFKNCYC